MYKTGNILLYMIMSHFEIEMVKAIESSFLNDKCKSSMSTKGLQKEGTHEHTKTTWQDRSSSDFLSSLLPGKVTDYAG